MDGSPEGPAGDAALIAAAIRHAKAQAQLDLSPCSQVRGVWNIARACFLELHPRPHTSHCYTLPAANLLYITCCTLNRCLLHPCAPPPQWLRFLELHYQRLDRNDVECHREVTVLFLVDADK